MEPDDLEFDLLAELDKVRPTSLDLPLVFEEPGSCYFEGEGDERYFADLARHG